MVKKSLFTVAALLATTTSLLFASSSDEAKNVITLLLDKQEAERKFIDGKTICNQVRSNFKMLGNQEWSNPWRDMVILRLIPEDSSPADLSSPEALYTTMSNASGSVLDKLDRMGLHNAVEFVRASWRKHPKKRASVSTLLYIKQLKEDLAAGAKVGKDISNIELQGYLAAIDRLVGQTTQAPPSDLP